MKVLDKGIDKRFKRTCVDCETTFEYTLQDTINSELGSRKLNCPVCNATIIHRIKQISNKARIEINRYSELKGESKDTSGCSWFKRR